MSLLKLVPVLVLSSLVAGPSVAQSVLRVDPSGGAGTFPDIATAVTAAVDGDLVLVEAGSYAGFVVDRGITVAAEAGADVDVVGSITVTEVPAGREAVLQGIDVVSSGTLLFTVLSVSNNSGHVQLQDVSVTVAGVALAGTVLLESNASVTLVDCAIDGSATFPSLYPGALNAVDTDVYLHRTTVLGSAGADGDDQTFNGQDGGAAVSLRGGTGLAVDCVLQGGDGGFGNVILNPGPGGDGGPALRLEVGPLAGAPTFTEYDSTLAGGSGGGALPPADPGSDGPETDIVAGTFDTPEVFARAYLADGVVRDGETSVFSFRGQPFDFTFLVIGIETSGSISYLPSVFGAFHPETLFFRFFGLLNALGEKDVTLTLSPTGLTYLPLWEQALMYNDLEGFVASNPRHIAFLDSTL